MKRLILLLLLVVAWPALAGPVALSGDGNWRAELSAPDRLVITATADGSIGASFTARARDGGPAGFEGVYTDPKRRHFVVPLVGAPEYWLIATDPEAPPVYEGFVHSREAGMIEGVSSGQGLFSRRRVLIAHELRQIEFSPDYLNMTGVSADGRLRITVNLYVNREVAWQPLD